MSISLFFTQDLSPVKVTRYNLARNCQLFFGFFFESQPCLTLAFEQNMPDAPKNPVFKEPAMNLNEHLATSLKSNFEMLKTTLADFSDADLLSRPAPNANHANWQIGHLIKSETGMLSAVGAKMPALPPDFEARYTKETASSND